MYLYHFGLRELPFTLTPNTDFYLNLQSHHEALQVLLTALKTGEGFIKVVGEVGTGKTLICRKVLNELPSHFKTAYIPNPYLSPNELRMAVAQELGIAVDSSADQLQLTQKIQTRLMALHQQGHSVVLLLDEAQALPDESLEALRLFTNLETERRKLLQVVLFGQPELDVRLADEKLRQLRQRITFTYDLRPMSPPEVDQYVAHRLQVAGCQLPQLFTSRGMRLLAHASRGIPRLVNVLCHKALLLSYGRGDRLIHYKDVRAAVKDTSDASQPSWSWLLFAPLSCFLAAATWLWWY